MNFSKIDNHWHSEWEKANIYTTPNQSDKPKFYVLDMFPYPSGAGLHVGHPLGYIASDIVSRYKRLKGFNVLHPMGFDAFGLPAEQYAIQTGQHPAKTTADNIATYKKQLKKIGFCYDWKREVNTSDPSYYRWTQWIFLQLFNSWYNLEIQKAEPIQRLIEKFETGGSAAAKGFCEASFNFSSEQWKTMSQEAQMEVLMSYRLAYQDYATVNWCEALGTVLANDEVKDGLSERGGHPVERRQMRQWFLRITAYAERLLNDLDTLNWSEAMKEMQRNWIGKSQGACVKFELMGSQNPIEVFTTRPDTIFGVSFLVLAPEHELVDKITTAAQRDAVDEYVQIAKNRSERERQADVKRVTGVFTGAYAQHPFTGDKIPVWIADYVLAGYGTGAVMAVPAGDQRDYLFAKTFDLPIPIINEGVDISEQANPTKEAKMINSGFLDGLTGYEAIPAAITAIETSGIGKGKTQYRLRDAGFSRQRYWGEPFPIVYKNGVAYALSENELPLELPELSDFKPTGKPESPLAKATDWVKIDENTTRETDTMPGYAGSSWYFLRYMDPTNDKAFVSKEAENYWQDVDLYIGGTEHAVGHLLYSRFWQKVLFDLGHVSKAEPFKQLVNQGMILGQSAKLKVINFFSSHDNEWKKMILSENSKYINLFSEHFTFQVVNYPIKHLKMENIDGVNYFVLDNISHNKTIEEFSFVNDFVFPSKKYINDAIEKTLIYLEDFLPYSENKKYDSIIDKELVKSDLLNFDGYSLILPEVEKMSKSKFNVVNPDDIIEQYGADTLRLYEMFLGPLEQSKPWNTNGIEGVYRFLGKLWRLFIDDKDQVRLSDEAPNEKEFRTLHKLIKKAEEDIERFSFNTSVSQFMICLNELTDLKCHKKAILKDLLVVIAPYAPHICEELWHRCGFEGFVVNAQWPEFNEKFLIASTVQYPVAFNGKTRFQLEVAADFDAKALEQLALSHSEAQKWLDGKAPKKVIVVPGRMVNIVV